MHTLELRVSFRLASPNFGDQRESLEPCRSARTLDEVFRRDERWIVVRYFPVCQLKRRSPAARILLVLAVSCIATID